MSDSGLSILLPRGGRDDGTQPGNTGPLPAPAGPGTAKVASPVLGITLKGGQQVSLGEQATAAARIACHEARHRFSDMRRHQGGLVHALFNEQPPSLQQECEYAQSRAWVPAGHEGGFAEAHGILFHTLIGRPTVAAGDLIAGIGHKPARWLSAAFLTLVLIFTGLCVTGNGGIAVILGYTLGALAVLWIIAAEAIRHLLNPQVTGADHDYAAPFDAGDDDAQLHADA
jgi:hypothetical protein